jgi:hypothetical protein
MREVLSFVKIQKEKGGSIMGGVTECFYHVRLQFCFLLVFRGAGGGKCPEEEHTTYSGGRQYLSQARFMGRENIFIIFYYKNEKNNIL